MTRSTHTTAGTPAANSARWGLEVVRGLEVGRVFPLAPGTLTLGNAPGGTPGLDLSAVEAPSPRKMAARQAELLVTSDPSRPPSLRDLDSPGGTFVNRQRLLAGQVRALEAGDVVQLGGVQLRVVTQAPATSGPGPATAAKRPSPPPQPVAPATSTAPPAGPLPVPFRLASGATCRSWDDFLTLSAQSWAALRDELDSGRLGAFLARNGLAALKPTLETDRSLDEHLDAWLGQIPTSRPASPQLDVHPEVVRIRAVPGGGLTRSRFVLINTGYRLLRSTVRVETPADLLLMIPPASAGPVATPDESEVIVEVNLPETVDRPLVAGLVVESNGGNRRVEVRVEPAPRAEPISEGGGHPSGAGAVPSPVLSGVAPGRRLAIGVVFGLLGWVVITLGDRLAGFVGSASVDRPGVGGPAILAAMVGGIAGLNWARRRGGAEDWIPCSLTGAMTAALATATWVALLRSFGTFGAGVIGSGLLSIGLGLLLAWGSTRVVPHAASVPGASARSRS